MQANKLKGSMSEFIDQIEFNNLSYSDKWRLARDTQIIRERLEQEITRLKARNAALEKVRKTAGYLPVFPEKCDRDILNSLVNEVLESMEQARSGDE
jgi:hypothetical protein